MTNVDLDHHSTFASRGRGRGALRELARRVPQVVRGDELEPVSFELPVPGEHNRMNAAAALAALELAGVARAEAEPVLARFRGAGRRFELRGEAGGVDRRRRLRAPPCRDRGHARRGAGATGGRVLVLFQPHLYSRTRHLAHELGAAFAAADAVCVTEIYAAREEPIDGVDGKLVVDALRTPGIWVGWAPDVEDAGPIVAAGRVPATSC